LADYGSNEHNEKYASADQISAVVRIYVCMQPGHRHRVTTRFAKRRSKYLDHPETECHLRDFAEDIIFVFHTGSFNASAPFRGVQRSRVSDYCAAQ
jgi:hypothetical protein